MIRLFLIDYHAIVRVGLRQILAGNQDFRIVGEAANGREALHRLRSLDCEGVVLEIDLPEVGGLEILRWLRIHRPKVKVAVLTWHNAEHLAQESLSAGAMGFLTKDCAPDLLLLAAQKIFQQNRRYVSPELAERLLDRMGTPHQSTGLDALSPREVTILQKLAQGFSQTRVAQELRISLSTVATHRRHILKKLGIEDTPALVNYALHHQLIGGSRHQTGTGAEHERIRPETESSSTRTRMDDDSMILDGSDDLHCSSGSLRSSSARSGG
ncbi:MAG: response regulator transcription factor [Magnetococcales bacterium]|nr:response regulator transcription factor [Magnetococcales bacterium]